MILMQVGFEFMVLDRKNTSIAGKEMIRHLENCKKYAEEHDAPCFLISVAMMPSSGDMSPQAEKVSCEGIPEANIHSMSHGLRLCVMWRRQLQTNTQCALSRRGSMDAMAIC